MQYDYALALQHLGRRSEAEAPMRRARALRPEDPQILRGLAILYAQQEKWREAEPVAAELVRLQPEELAYRQMLQTIEAELGSASSDSSPGATAPPPTSRASTGSRP